MGHQIKTLPETIAHTAGRWQIDECLDAYGWTTVRPSDGSANGETEVEPVATVYCERNARLIAAAPSLFEALQQAAAALAVIGNNSTESHTKVFARDGFAAARAALAKVTD